MPSRTLRGVLLLVAVTMPGQVAPVAADSNAAPTIVAIAAGGGHTCAVTDVGGVKCWGDNELGQLGDGTTTDSTSPVDVVGLANGVTAIAAGGSHTCALTANGEVKCWGWNDNGQLGNGTTKPDSLGVFDVVGLDSNVTAIDAGWGGDTCALLSSGRARCWGFNTSGQLGGGTTTDDVIPVDVAGFTGRLTALAAGLWHTCALNASGGVACWGLNSDGELGDGTTTDTLVPVDVSGLAGAVTAITAGAGYSCALLVEGRVSCWGRNDMGQLGNGTTTGATVPTGATALGIGLTAIDAGGYHACAVTVGGGVKCWGLNDKGQLGNGTTTSSSTPVDVSGFSTGVTAIAAAYSHTCALIEGGVQCWGSNDHGQLGDDSTTSSMVPVEVDFSDNGAPRTDAAGPGLPDRHTATPLLPLLAGLCGGLAVLVRRRRRANDNPAVDA